jgi:anti-sigma factor RsiW
MWCAIRVQGELAPMWTEWFDGLTMSVDADETRLTGFVADQAALHGLLAKIRDLGLPLRGVECRERAEAIFASPVPPEAILADPERDHRAGI